MNSRRRILLAVCAIVVAALFDDAAAAQKLLRTDDRPLLEANGIDAEVLAGFTSGRPLDAAERKPLLTTFAVLRQISTLELDRAARSVTKAEDLTAADAAGRLFQLRGRLKTIASDELTDEELSRVYAEVDDLPAADPRRRFYRTEIELDGSTQTLEVLTLRLPAKLAGEDRLDERVGVQGVLVKNAGAEGAPRPLLVARRLAWYPTTELGDLGMDYALFDDVRLESHDLKRERECFYQLLATMRRADFDDLLRETAGPHSVVPLFNEAATMHGKLTALEGTARRAVKVVIDPKKEPDVHERFGFAHFYEVAIYTADSQQNPLLFNVLELPADLPQGENIHAAVRIPGTFLTGFYYNRDATPDEQAKGIRPKPQKAPLLMGKGVLHLPEPTHRESMFDWIFASLVAGAMVVLVIGVWRLMRSERKTRELLQRQMAPPPGTSLNDAPVEYRARPDFSNLDEPPPSGDTEPPQPG